MPEALSMVLPLAGIGLVTWWLLGLAKPWDKIEVRPSKDVMLDLTGRRW